MSGLTDRTDGYVARRVRERLGVGTAARVAEQGDRLARIEWLLAYQLRAFRGFRLEVPGREVIPGSDGWVSLSTNEYAQFQRTPNKLPHHAKLSVDIEAIRTAIGACTAGIVTNIDCNSDSLTATTCGATVTHASGNALIAVHVTGSANAQQLNYHWCAPTGDPPATLPGEWQYGNPAGFIELPAGEPCAGGCTAKLVPYWNKP